MLVCHCHRVTDRELRDAARRGEFRLDCASRACLAGSGCGGCRSLVESIVEAEERRCAPSAPAVYVPLGALARPT
jgi:bacterioferritin-associated ferredoxin